MPLVRRWFATIQPVKNFVLLFSEGHMCSWFGNSLSQRVTGSVMDDDVTFDPTQFESYYNRAEVVPGLDLTGQTWTRQSLLTRLRELLSEHPPLLRREFISVTPAAPPATAASPRVRVMQWNVLAQALCVGADNFVRCPPGALSWPTRRLRMLEEILAYDPDVVCLQEVDHFGFLSPALAAVGYAGSFCPKPDSPAMHAPDSNGPDGCAVFYRQAALTVVGEEVVVLRDARGDYTNQVAVISTLQPRASSATSAHRFCVAATHLKAKAGWHQLRHEQGAFLLRRLAARGQHALVVCGDFNADALEPVYDAFSQSELRLASAYTHLPPEGATDHTGRVKSAEPAYTTWKIRGDSSGEVDVCRTIDYIWYSSERLQVAALLEFPSAAAIGADRLPSYQYASDHLSLVADFVFV